MRRERIAAALALIAWAGWAAENDRFDDAALINGLSVRAAGDNYDCSAEGGEGDHAGQPAAASVWWVWTTAVPDRVTVETLGSDFDTVLAVYRGVRN